MLIDNITRWLRGNRGSKEIGKSRLKLILAYDRLEISPEILDALKEEIFQTISKYFNIKEGDVEMNISKTDQSVALMANIPIIGMKERQPATSDQI